MAIAAPRRSGLQTAPAPSRTAPPEPKKRPRDRPRPGGSGRSVAAAPEALRKEGGPRRKAGRQAAAGTAAPKRKAGSRASAATDSPIRKTSPKRKKATSARAATAAPARKSPRRVSTDAPARKTAPRKASTAAPARKPSRKSGLVTAPSRHKAAPRRRARVLPYAAGTAGRAAVAVTQLPESGLIHRLTRGRAWIGLLGVLLVGIVALNVVTLSFAASAGKVEAVNTELSKENSVIQGRAAKVYGQERMRGEAAELGLALPTEADSQPQLITVRKSDAADAAARLAAAAAANPE
ncbi:MAG TPA: hypothetical protein VHA76_12865 [Solirubrobacterales bacterium]|nr:hypothetical protein [Solirubrobacterales bacterium]